MAFVERGLPTVLVAESAADFRQLLVSQLTGEGFAVDTATSGRAAVDAARDLQPDVIVLDLALPDTDGIEVCRRIHDVTAAPVLVLAGECRDIDRLHSLPANAGHYLMKPLTASAVARRAATLLSTPAPSRAPTLEQTGRVCVRDIDIDIDARAVTVADTAVDLTSIEFDIVAALAGRPSTVFSRQMLLEEVWGGRRDDAATPVQHHVVDVRVAELRRKLDHNGVHHIKTVRGVGYQLA